MTFSQSLQRGFKHTARALSKPFTGANKENLRELEKIMVLLSQGRKLEDLQPHQLRFASFDFNWLHALTADELRAFRGEWDATLQSTIRTSTGHGFAQSLNVATRTILMNSTDKDLWNALQESKNRYKGMAEAHIGGMFLSARLWVAAKRERVDDMAHRGPWVGPYLTAAATLEATYDMASRTGARTETDQQILAAGGLWRVAKHAVSFGRSVAESIATLNPNAIKNAVMAGGKVLNHLGGLIAGIVDLVQNKEADFRALSSRLGVDQKLAYMKKKYLGSGVVAEGDSLRFQMEQGPGRLEKAAELTAEELDELIGKYRHALWWCQNWEADCAEIEADLAESDVVKHLRQLFGEMQTQDGLIRPSQIAEHNAFLAPDRDALRAQVAALKERVAGFKAMIGPRLKDMEELQGSVDTRRGIATQQRQTAALGLNFDLKRQIATEIAGPSAPKLRPVGSRERAPSTAPDPTADTSLAAIVSRALADRRRYIAPNVDADDDDPWDPDS